jgi:ribose/xylose/arabinose/galactoside ABC-type transport system permease subunit
LAWVVPLIVGPIVGAFIGFLVAYMRIPAIVVTLGMKSILQGGLIIATGGTWIYNLPEGYGLAQERWLGIPAPVYFMIILAILAALWMRYSGLGRAIYAVGGNAEAARLSGINEQSVVLRVFIINGLMVGIASVLFATKFNAIQSTVPPGIELQIITAAVVGGVSILGGTGTVIGAMLAAIFIMSIGSAMTFARVSDYWIQAIQGVLILITVLVDLFRRRQMQKGA